ncbi:MAG TPA: flagellar hook-associated protein FlgK [Desulfobacterales bacterium]|nr:flagellar hook-associated protein FlgK [Desulfobacterales bacterium]
MTNLLGVLSVGTSSLLAQQRAINVTGNNIANVNTPGYSRQRVSMQTGTTAESAIGMVAFGVNAGGVERIYDRFLGVQLDAETSGLGRWQAQQGMLDRVEVVFDESGGYGLNQALSEFWNGWQDLAMNPSGTTERTVLAGNAQNLADAIRGKYTELEKVQTDIDGVLTGGLADVNRLTSGIAELNRKIAAIETTGGTANDFRDSRELALKELSEIISVSSYEDSQGQLVVSTGSGRTLVESGNTWALTTRVNSAGHVDVMWPDASSGTDISAEIAGGKIGGWLQVRDVKIDAYQTRLNDLAQGLITEVNTLHTGGFDLNGVAGAAFFTGTGAADIAMSSAILSDTDRIAAAQTAAGAPGNAGNAIAIHALRNELTLGGGTTTFDDAANSLVSLVGSDAAEAKVYAAHQADMTSYLQSYRDSVSGVALDEEMVNLVKFQAAYNAAAKMITMADDMLDTLLGMVR